MIAQPNRFFNVRIGALSVLVIGALAASLLWWLKTSSVALEEYASFTRPDQHYKILVMRKRMWNALMPGQTSDSPGVVWLLDKDGNVLNQAAVEMVQLVDHVDWQDKKVSIKLIADWDLPD